MKTLFNSLYLFAMLVLLNCQDVREQNDKKTFSKGIGQRIPYATAQRWMANYSENQGRQKSQTYSLTASQFHVMLQAVSNKTGVMLRHATDHAGTHHILVKAIGENADDVWATVVLDANTDNQIDNAEAKAWATNYENAHPGEVWGHFFGINIIEEVTANPNFTYMEIEPALNDEGAPQLLLLLWSNNANGRTQGEDPVVIDFSSPCPPCA